MIVVLAFALIGSINHEENPIITNKTDDGKWYLEKDLGHFKDNKNKAWECTTPPVASLTAFVKAYAASAKRRTSPRNSPRKQTAQGGAIVSKKAGNLFGCLSWANP